MRTSKLLLFCLVSVLPVNKISAVDKDTANIFATVARGTNDSVNAINVTVTILQRVGFLLSTPAEDLEAKRLKHRETLGHEYHLGHFVPFRVDPGNFRYGADGIYEQDRATANIHRLCGRGINPWARFLVSNANLGFDPKTGEIKDPVRGKNKMLFGSYRCISGVDGRVISEHEIGIKEREEAFLSCVDKDRTIFETRK